MQHGRGVGTKDKLAAHSARKACDAGIQWTLFMPGLVQEQMKGFRLASFEYKQLPAMRFIGMKKDFSEDPQGLAQVVDVLDSLASYRSGFDQDAVLFHHLGKGVDVERRHDIYGRFMAPDTPVPQGFVGVDFSPQDNRQPGQPYLSQFACAVFAGGDDALHRREGFDSDAMYDVTRNIILGQNIAIPYPDKYWTAEVYPQGFDKEGNIYLFSVQL